jgi:catechol 2,3-dioxygenase-like lactoylglutathione lyase family enzyme
MQFAHLHLMVADLDRSVAFYETNLGFRYSGRQIIDPGRFITEHWMRPGTEIAFVTDPQGAELALEKTDTVTPLPPWFHFGFLLPSEEAVTSLYANLTDRGVRMRKLTRQGACLGFRCYDPDGYLLEFCFTPERVPAPVAASIPEVVGHD